jgi:dihydropyrimidinase
LPQKGAIREGLDGDVVVYDPAATQTLGQSMHHMNLDHSAYEGMKITGKVRTVVSRGEVIVDNGEFFGTAGRGQYLRRAVSQHIR